MIVKNILTTKAKGTIHMIREIIKDKTILNTISKKVNPKSTDAKRIIQDLIDTAKKHADRCVGLAAIQINEPVRIFIVKKDMDVYDVYINPTIIQTYGEKYETEEGCMSFDGTKTVTRSKGVILMHQKNNKFIRERFSGFYAEIIQHEMDHLNGKLI